MINGSPGVRDSVADYGGMTRRRSSLGSLERYFVLLVIKNIEFTIEMENCAVCCNPGDFSHR